MLRRVAAAAALSVALVMGAGALGVVGASYLGPAAPAAAQAGPPSSEPATDLRSDKLSGPFLNDSNPTRAVGVPMLVAGIAIMAVIITLITRSRSRRRTQGQALSENSALVNGDSDDSSPRSSHGHTPR